MIGRIAWRNLWRNRTRTTTIIMAIAISYGLMLWMFGVADDSYREMGEATVAAAGGHVLIHGEGYWDLPTGGQTVEEPDARREYIEAMPQVQAVAERVMGFGLLSTADTSEGVQIMGIRPDDERVFFDVESRLIEGDFLGDQRTRPAVLGQGEAQTLGVGIGDRVIVTASDLDGEVTRGLFHVDGLLRSTPGQAGEGRVYVQLADLQELLGYGEAVTQIGIRLHDDETRNAVAASIIGQYSGDDIEVLTWDEAIPELVALIEFDEAFTYIYVFIIMVIVVLGITNTFLMAVMERVREIGLFSALGLTPRRIGFMIIVETAIVTAIGMALGLALGLAGHFWMVEYGIDLTQLMDMEMEIGGVGLDMLVIHSYLNVQRWVIGSIVIFVFISASALYPAWRATRLAPSEAMRFYE